MGIGDQVIATGLSRGAAARGKRVAFGPKVICWDHNSPAIFKGNPSIAVPGVHYDPSTLEWIDYRKGHRIYNTVAHDRWLWNHDFHVTPGEVFLDPPERAFAERDCPKRFVLIEPNIPAKKGGAYLANKQWPLGRYQEVVNALTARGHHVVQFVLGDRPILSNVKRIEAPTFRHALAVLERASLYVGTEGGLHHGAAAVGVPAVVLFGGWVPADVLGYASHVNLIGGSDEACGLFRPCEHCRLAMARISTEEVLAEALSFLGGGGGGLLTQGVG